MKRLILLLLITALPVLGQRLTARVTWDDEATTGDTATGFFDAGTIEHERGGIEADVSAYSGLIGIASGATSEVDTEAEFEAMVAALNFLIETEIDASAELLAIMDDETGDGLLVFNGSPTIVTPTIASFLNAAHDHADAAGGDALAADTVGTSQIDDGTVATVDVVAALKSWPFNLTVTNVVANDELYAVQFPTACTISRLSCVTATSETATVQFEERTEATRWSAGTDVATSVLLCVAGGVNTTTFTNATIAANAPLVMMIDASSASGILSVHGTCVAD